MVTAILLMNVEKGKINEVATRLADVEGVAEVYSIAGRFDLAAILRVRTSEALADLVTQHLHQVPGITDTETMIAFRAWSKHDLEAAFSLGME